MSTPLPSSLPTRFGRYLLLKLLGEGGMGWVYLAKDVQLDRQVALKIPNLEAGEGRHVLSRFFREARAAAGLLHPNICPVHEVGEVDGVPYLTMAYIQGKPLSEVAAAQPVNARQAVVLVRKLALALQEAHRVGIVHRDLKPSNVMIDRRGEPIIMDFGLAKRMGAADTRLTQRGAAIGTPAYMSPEQVLGKVGEMGPACDVYSLGVVLYELLAHRLPFPGPDLMTMLSQVVSSPPPPPSRFHPGLDPRLEAVCLKALAKNPADRHASMADMAAGLLSCLRGGISEATTLPPAGQVYGLAPEPGVEDPPAGIHATQMGGLRSVAQLYAYLPPPAAAAKAAPAAKPERPLGRPRRDPERKSAVPILMWIVCGVAAVLLPVAAFLGYLVLQPGSTGTAERNTGGPPALSAPGQVAVPEPVVPEANDPANRLTEDEKKAGWRLLFDGQTTSGWRATNGRPVPARWQVQGGALVLGSGPRAGGDDLATREEFGDFDLTFEWRISPGGASGVLYHVAEGLGPPASTGPEYRILDNAGNPAGHGADTAAASCYGLYGPTADRTRPPGEWNRSRLVVRGDRVEHWLNDERVLTYTINSLDWDRRVQASVFANLPRFGKAPRGHIVLRDAGDVVAYRNLKIRPLEGEGSDGPGQPRSLVRLGRARTIAWQGARSVTVALAPGSDRLLVGSSQPPFLRLYDAANGNVIHDLEGHSAQVNQVAISPDGRLGLSAGQDRTMRLWDLTSGKSVGVPARHDAPVLCVAFSADGRRALSGAANQLVRLWNLTGANFQPSFAKATAAVQEVTFSPDGRRVLAAGLDGRITAWDHATHQELRSFEGGLSVVFTADGRRALSGAGDAVRLWDAANGQELNVFRADQRDVRAVSVAPDGRWGLATDHQGQAIYFWDLNAHQLIRRLALNRRPIRAVVAPDGRSVACGCAGGIIYIWPILR